MPPTTRYQRESSAECRNETLSREERTDNTAREKRSEGKTCQKNFPSPSHLAINMRTCVQHAVKSLEQTVT